MFPRIPVVVIVSLMDSVFKGMVGLPVGAAVVEKNDQEVVLGESPLKRQNLHLEISMSCSLEGIQGAA